MTAHNRRERAACARIFIRALIASAALAGCPDAASTRNSSGPAHPKGCTKAYEQCELGAGLLGVCDVVDCPPGAAEPCLRCRSQH
jgi:hypothetical protein